MNLESLLDKLELEAEKTRKRPTVQVPKPASRTDANNAKIRQLRKRTDAMRVELESNKQLAAATKSHQDASVALYLANLTPVEKAERDEDARRMAVYASQFCREASQDWRQQAQEEFAKKRL